MARVRLGSAKPLNLGGRIKHQINQESSMSPRTSSKIDDKLDDKWKEVMKKHDNGLSSLVHISLTYLTTV